MQQTPGLEESVSGAEAQSGAHEDEEVSQSQSGGGGLCCSLLWVTPVLGLGASSGCRAGQSSYRRAVPVPTSMPTALIKKKKATVLYPADGSDRELLEMRVSLHWLVQLKVC